MTFVNKILRKFGVHDAIYDRDYYEADVEEHAARAAPHIAESVIERYSPRTLVDVGCGTGAIMDAFKQRGVEVNGLEYSTAGIEKCRQRGLSVMKYDIVNGLVPPLTLKSDIVLSTEVAEHLPASAAKKYVELLCTLAPVVILTAAPPGQDGTDHINLQPKEYWMKLFAYHGRASDLRTVDVLSSCWKANGVAGFYYENLMVFATRAAR